LISRAQIVFRLDPFHDLADLLADLSAQLLSRLLLQLSVFEADFNLT